jgi:pimeloyl-[acyl-carrier protein] methyl ester esterase
MNLHVETTGRGAPLLFLHGWGMHSGMWGESLPQLAENFCVSAVDLPGHGLSAGSGKWQVASGKCVSLLPTPHSPLPTSHIDDIVDQLAAQFREPLTLCGWSLGGQIALRWAMRCPEQVQRLVLISSTPCFAQRDGWECAMPQVTLAEFSASHAVDQMATLRRFLGLLTRGGENERALLLALRGELLSRGEPDKAALQAGLGVLRDVDLRAVLPEIHQPTLIIAGERDTLTPLAASQYMADFLPNARLVTIAGAAHLPFRSAGFVKQLTDFLHE